MFSKESSFRTFFLEVGRGGGDCTKRRPSLKLIKTANLVAPSSASVKNHV